MIPDNIKEKIASYVYKFDANIQMMIKRDVEFGFSLAQEKIAELKHDFDVMVKADERNEQEIERLKAENQRLHSVINEHIDNFKKIMQ